MEKSFNDKTTRILIIKSKFWLNRKTQMLINILMQVIHHNRLALEINLGVNDMGIVDT